MLILCAGALGGIAPSASALVSFGHGVSIGGHDFSNQTYDRKHRAIITLYERTPHPEGCVWRSDRHGGGVKICRLRRIGPR